jgi:hypothetical protein
MPISQATHRSRDAVGISTEGGISPREIIKTLHFNLNESVLTSAIVNDLGQFD